MGARNAEDAHDDEEEEEEEEVNVKDGEEEGGDSSVSDSASGRRNTNPSCSRFSTANLDSTEKFICL